VGIDAGVATAGVRLVAPYRIHAGALLEPGATVGPEVVVGAGARVAAGATVHHAVLWSGVQVTGDLAHAVVTPEGTVAVD
jgi:acetyltransferase-like isoleucine patch superfamily enzyme